MPGYGKQTSGAGRGFWRACRNHDTVCNHYQPGSLLACNFNQLWCQVLNMVNSGKRVDYFAMLHDDISPEDFWLDKLIDELEANDLDVLGVVTPIKDFRGLTSMSLYKTGPDGGWLPEARLSMHDVYELPETFTSKDLGKLLLLNTGCWVAKWNQEWCKEVHFAVMDRIVFNRSSNCYQAQCYPEDWMFSQQLHSLDLKVGATRKVALRHSGEVEFPNELPWGREPFDRETCKFSPVPNAFPHEIPGWLFPEEGKALADLARDKRVLEIGSYCGLSTVCMARTAQHVTAVDYFDGRGTPNPVDTLEAFQANVRRYGLDGKVTICHPDAAIPLPNYQLALIDGAHDRDAVRCDVYKAMTVLADDGLLAFHDYGERSHPAVTEAVDEIISCGGELISTHKTLAVVRPPAAIPLEV